MITVLGFLLLVAGIVFLAMRPYLQTEDKVETIKDDRFGLEQTVKTPKSSPILLSFSRRPIAIGFILVGIAFILFSSSTFYARDGFQYRVVSPTGKKYAEFTQGWKFMMPFSKIQEWQKFFDIKSVNEGESTEGIEGVIKGGIPIRFIDQVTAEVQVSVRMQMPSDEKSFLRLAQEFRHPENLVNNTLVPTVREQVINTGYMFAAQDYISGSAADFRITLDEQLKDGGYSVEKKEFNDTTYLNVDIKQNETDRQIKDIRTRYVVTKRLGDDGKPKRNDHDIKKNNIIVSQVIVDEVKLEDAFKKRLEKQRDISAQKRIELEMIETAKAAQQRIVAEGERDKAQERAVQEKDQVGVLIAIETKLKQEETNKNLAKIQLETERLKSQAKKVAADAESYKNTKLVRAGLTPQEKAEWEYKTRVGVATEMAKLKLPQTVFMGSESKGGGDGLLSSLLGAKIAEGMIEKK